MEKTVKHRFLNNALFTALIVPLAFFVLRDTIAVLTGIMFESMGGKESFLYQINDDISRLIIAGLLMLILLIFFRGKCNFGFKGGLPKLGILLSLPALIVPLWNLLQIKVYDAPLVAGTTAVFAAIVHGIGPGVSEEVFCRGFAASNLMRIWKDKPNRIFLSVLVSGAAFGLLHAVNVIVTGDAFAAIIQVIYTAAIGIFYGAVFVRSRNIWGVIIMHTLTDVSAFIAVFDGNVTGMDIAFCAVGSLIFIAIALYLIRPAKRAEIDALWEDGWSFGDENGKTHAGAKAAAVVSAVVVIAFAASIGVMLYQTKMGYDIPMFPAEQKEIDKDVQYKLSDDKTKLTILLPYVGGETYDLENSDSESLALDDCRENGDTYIFEFSHKGTGTENVKLTFSKTLGDMPVAIEDYTVTVSFNADGTISSVGG